MQKSAFHSICPVDLAWLAADAAGVPPKANSSQLCILSGRSNSVGEAVANGMVELVKSHLGVRN